ncbi:MAG TPA: hypothetical protein VFA43_02790 [Gemmatimonadaceae bacterium]|nr:hypothetical protein [Gemmatimonadaceae bacterium]
MKPHLTGIVSAAAIALVVVSCSSSTSPSNNQKPSVQITIGPPTMTVDTTEQSVCTTQVLRPGLLGSVRPQCTLTYYTDTLTCPTVSPNPASASAGEDVTWFNNSGSSLTIFNVSDGNTPVATIEAGATSNPVYWPAAGTVTYSVSTCVITGHNPQQTQPPTETIYITTG